MLSRLGGTPEQLLRRAAWFVRLRWLAIVATSGGAVAAKYVLGVDAPLREILYLTGVLVLYNIAFLLMVHFAVLRSKQTDRVEHASLLPSVQIVLDLLALGYLVHLTGGVESPIIVFFIFHMVIASILLPSRLAYMMCVLVIVLLGGLVSFEYLGIIPHRHLHGFMGEELFQHPQFAFGVLGIVSGSLIFTVYLANSIAAEVWERDRNLLEARQLLRKKTEELALANVRLMKIEERKSRFMRAAAHQLKAPLSAVNSMLRVILGGYFRGGPEKQLEMIERVERRTGEMILLVNDLILLARSREWVPADIRKQPVALDSLMSTMAETFRTQAEQKGLELRFRAEPGTYTVMGDEEALRDVLSNLVSNAVKYTFEGFVELSVEKRGAAVQCTVQDTGVGIPQDELSHVFEEFYRGSNVRTEIAEGTGLGLSIVEEVIHRHGGNVQIWSKVGQGTKVVAILPAAKGRAVEQETARS